MQKIADETKVVSINLTKEQADWLQKKGRKKSEFIRTLLDMAMQEAG